MTYKIVIILVAAMMAGASACLGELNMVVHRDSTPTITIVSEIDSITFVNIPPMVLVPAGVFTMGDGISYGGMEEREVTLTNSFYLGQYEITNQQYLEAVQWAYDEGHVTASSTSVLDNLDGSTQELVDLNDEDCEIAFLDGVFSIRDVGRQLPRRSVGAWAFGHGGKCVGVVQ